MRVLIQFDGSNFYRKVKQLSKDIHLTNFDYVGLARSLVTESVQQETQIVYYVGEIRQYNNQPKSKQLFSGQQKLFRHLKEQGILVKLGYLLLSDGVFHEKGVDVQIAVDIVRGALRDDYDVCYLLSSDTDLLPAILTAKEEGKKIVYVGFENFMSRALMKNCSSSIILKKESIKNFS